MGRLDDIELRELHELLAEVEEKKPAQRVLAAIARKQGTTIDGLAEQHNVAEKTIRNWLIDFLNDRFQTLRMTTNELGDPRSYQNHSIKNYSTTYTSHQPSLDTIERCGFPS